MQPLLTVATLALTSVASAAAPISAAPSCRLTSHDSAWTAAALDGWSRQMAALGRRDVRQQPTLVLFDDECAFTLVPAGANARPEFITGGHRFQVRAEAHGGTITLPDGKRIPARLTSFAAPQPNGAMFFVMALPSVWRTNDRDPGGGDRLATAVFMHEFTHTQSTALSAIVDSLTRHGLPEDADDDVIQQRFGNRPDFRAEYEAERELLYKAASAPTTSRARALAARALDHIEQRRTKTFAGADSVYAVAEDVFLTMEGLAQWVAYRWLRDPRGAAMTADEALPFVRRGGRQWSQDEGLALLLVLDRLAPSAAGDMLASRPTTVFTALRAAVPR